MNIFVTGGTGFIGRHLIQTLSAQHSFTVLTRSLSKARTTIGEKITLTTELPPSSSFEHYDAVINLAGEPIADKRWHAGQKRRLWRVAARSLRSL